jgi:hypothetical protein
VRDNGEPFLISPARHVPFRNGGRSDDTTARRSEAVWDDNATMIPPVWILDDEVDSDGKARLLGRFRVQEGGVRGLGRLPGSRVSEFMEGATGQGRSKAVQLRVLRDRRCSQDGEQVQIHDASLLGLCSRFEVRAAKLHFVLITWALTAGARFFTTNYSPPQTPNR